ncbi:hypothetical protein [Sinorhizobium fredii]|uniref:COG3904 family protein n=1 Tax=Rhizobium fredii TaxID=380 RepID=UPI0004BCB454|nr:hypothetical protein [Sinorhizobium fredii]ASY71337.1 hypothetical protein SF83666_c39500 [Sinorhizobium fredii CCBAU 83666]
MISRLVLVAFTSICFWVAGASAAIISKSGNNLCILTLDGEIVKGDLARFEALAATEFKGFDGESTSKDTICLNSPGGDLLEGVQLAELFYKRGVGTVIDRHSECYSICAIMFMMGIAQGPEVKFVNRRMHIAGKLGFHRPFLSLDSDELVSTRALPIAHDMAIEAIVKIMILANNPAPWSNATMIRPDLVQLMLKHVGADLYYIDTVEKAGRFNIELFGYEPAKGLNETQAYYACENSFHWQVGLVGKETDYAALSKAISYQKLVSSRQDKEGNVIYEVIGEDSGYSSASCLISLRRSEQQEYILGCGYNEVYGVSVGQGRCSVDGFKDSAVYISKLATFKPTTLIANLGKSEAPEPLVGERILATCVVISPSRTVEQEPCSGLITDNVYIDSKRADRYEFTWPSGNKTTIARDGATYTINGKPAYTYRHEKFDFCAMNAETGNQFCFKRR